MESWMGVYGCKMGKQKSNKCWVKWNSSSCDSFKATKIRASTLVENHYIQYLRVMSRSTKEGGLIGFNFAARTMVFFHCSDCIPRFELERHQFYIIEVLLSESSKQLTKSMVASDTKTASNTVKYSWNFSSVGSAKKPIFKAGVLLGRPCNGQQSEGLSPSSSTWVLPSEVTSDMKSGTSSKAWALWLEVTLTLQMAKPGRKGLLLVCFSLENNGETWWNYEEPENIRQESHQTNSKMKHQASLVFNGSMGVLWKHRFPGCCVWQL